MPRVPRTATPDFHTEPRIPLPGSERPAITTGLQAAARSLVSNRKRITVSVILHCAKPIPDAAVAGKHLSRAQFRAAHAASPAAVQAVTRFAKAFGLTSKADTVRRTVQLTGTVKDMQEAFAVTLHQHTVGNNSYRVREGSIQLPQSLLQHVLAVVGLDDRPQATPKFRIAHARTINASFTPPQLAQLYGFPANAKATGQTIALIELGGGFRTADLKAYFQSLSLATPTVTAISVDGGKNTPGDANGADGEVMLDIEVAGAVAPGAKIAVYFAPNTDQGFIDAITTATHDTTNKPSVISISWGGPESSWTAQARNALDIACKAAAALGITITVAAGDNGSDDGVGDGNNHVDFPASSPNVLACGGTKLTTSNGQITSEVVWNETANEEGATGGGISTAFPQPSWQSSITATKSGRGVPDVSGDADPTTGYQIRVDGQTQVIGGTSAVAPLWAGLIALSNAANKNLAGLPQVKLYTAAGQKALRDIAQGNNGAYKAAVGWDACTGLGSPNGTAIIALLATTASKKSTKKKATKK